MTDPAGAYGRLTVPAGSLNIAPAEPPPPNIVIPGANRQPLVTIHPDGTLTYGPDYTPDEAAQVFWQAVASLSPGAYTAKLEVRWRHWKKLAQDLEADRDRLKAERDQYAAGIPLICEDERHQAKVRGLEELLAASQKATEHWEAAYTREVAAHGRTGLALADLARTTPDNPPTSTNTMDNREP